MRTPLLLLFAGIPFACRVPGRVSSPSIPPRAFEIRVDGGQVPAEVTEALSRCARSHERWFGARPEGLIVELVRDLELAPEYDHFDPATNRIRMGWYAEPGLLRWTLSHELAHAFQWAFDPHAYEQEPSWIHEGLAEYLVVLELRGRDPAAADAFLRRVAENYLGRGLPFERVFLDVYQAPWERTYPAAHLAVEVLARRPGGKERLRDYFRRHGDPPPARVLREVFGCGPRELAREVEALARELARSDPRAP